MQTLCIFKAHLPTLPLPRHPPNVEKADPRKAKTGPGRLNFRQLGTFESKKDVNCITCKKKIVGQPYLTHKVGEFNCKACNAVIERKCHMCHKNFREELDPKNPETKVLESNAQCFTDDEGHKICATCVKIYQEEKKLKAKQQAEAEAAAYVVKVAETPVATAAEAAAQAAKVIKTIHCDTCSEAVDDASAEFDGGKFHVECLVCYSCKCQLKDKKVYREDKGLACEKCKKTTSCKIFLIKKLPKK